MGVQFLTPTAPWKNMKASTCAKVRSVGTIPVSHQGLGRQNHSPGGKERDDPGERQVGLYT